jgi:uncharacterized protein YqgC (DUF456 family)
VLKGHARHNPRMTATTLVAAVLVVLGLAGILVPVLPGLLLVLGGIGVWAFARHDTAGWVVLGLAAVIVVAGSLAKYLWPGRRLRESGVPWVTLAVGGALGVVGFFVIPVVGLVLGFVLGVYLAEWQRLGVREQAWPSTRRALAAVGWSILIELATGLLAAAVWVTGLIIG